MCLTILLGNQIENLTGLLMERWIISAKLFGTLNLVVLSQANSNLFLRLDWS